MNTKERILLLLLGTINFTHIMDFMIMMPLGNYLMPHFDISSGAFSLLVAAYTFSAGTSGFLASFFVDRFDRKRVLLFGYSGFLLGTLCCAIAPSFELLMAARIVAGLFGGLIGAQVLSIVSDVIPYERRAAAMGIIMAAFSVASVFGVPFGLYIANHIDWHAPFYFVAGLGIVLLPFLFKYIPAMNSHLGAVKAPRENPLVMLKGVFQSRDQVYALLLSAGLMLGHFLIIPFLNPFMEFNMGFSKTETPMIYLVGGALTLFSSPLIGKLADRIGKLRLFTIIVVVSIAPVAFITNLPAIPFYLVLCVTGFWFMVSSGRAIPAQTMISQVVPPARRGSFMSINSSVQQLATGLASLIAGYLVVKTPDNKILHYEWTGYLSIAVILSTIFLARRLHINMPGDERAATGKVAQQTHPVPILEAEEVK